MLTTLLVDAVSSAPSMLGMQVLLMVAQCASSLATHTRMLVLTYCADVAALGAAPAASSAAYGGAWGITRSLQLEHPAARVRHNGVADLCQLAANLGDLSPDYEGEMMSCCR